MSIRRALGFKTHKRADDPPIQSRKKRGLALATTALTVIGTLPFAGVTAAQAAPGDTSASEARFLGGSLLVDGLSLDAIAELASAESSHAGVGGDDIHTSDIDLSALNLVNVEVPGGISIPVLGEFLQLGAVNQYTIASDNGVSRAATGAVSDGGIVDTTGTAEYPANANLSLTPLLGTAITDTVASLDLEIGAITAEAALNAAATPSITRDYSIAGATLHTQVPAIGGLVDTLVGTGGVASTVDTAVNGLAGPNGTLATTIGGLNALLQPLLDDDALTVEITTDIAGALNTILDTPLTNEGITINLRTGAIEADLNQLLINAEPHNSLNNLNPNQEILSPEVLSGLVDGITDLLNTVPDLVETALTTTLNAAQLTITADTRVLGTGILVDVSGTLGQIASGGGTASITVYAAGLETLSLPANTILGALLTPITNALFDPENGVIASVQPTIDNAVAGILTPLRPAFSLINGVASLKGNVQEDSAGVYDEIALRLTVGDVLGTGGIATVELARATVGPNALAPAATAPSITDITPNTGPETGGTDVTITGEGFTDCTAVTFDGVNGTDFTVVSDTEITVTTPAGTAGVAEVIIVCPDGNSEPGEFTYLAVPSITSLNPTEGPEAGGTEVTITGTGFTGATGVTFDGNAGTSFVVVSDTTITVTTPAGTPGPVDVVVNAPGGDSNPGQFTYLAAPGAPTITDLDPTSGPETGGTAVTITGTGFTGATGVTFDGNAGTSFVVESDTEITVTTPARTPGAVDVHVLHPAGSSAPGEFTYLAVPSITSLSPTEGPETGGTEVTITGTGFTGATGVTFDGANGTDFVVVSDTEIAVTTPAGTPGAVDVIVEHPVEDSTPGDFTYLAVPSITSLTPTEGPETGGTVVTIIGTGFTGATGVTFDGADGTSFTVVSDTEITVTTPAGTPGAADVIVEHPVEDSAPGDFTYLAVPSITSLNPTEGPETGGTVVTITGTGFTGATGVTFDGADGTSFIVVSDTEITVTTPAGTPGVADVIIEHPVEDSTPGDFTYLAVPSITSLSPTEGPETGGTVVTIIGTGFTGATGVTFDGATGTSFTVVSDTEITVTTPAGTPGAVDVIVEHPVEDSTPGDFTYLTVPSITGISPDEGPESGGTPVTITGTGFTNATGVTFDGAAGTAFTVVSDTEITVTTPAGTPGVAEVIVEHPVEDSTPGDFTYLPAPAAPTITGLDPTSGPETGGTEVTITGTGFTGATGVIFDGNAGTDFVVVSDTEITVTTPAGTPGAVDVNVQHPAGASAPGEFTYLAVPSITSLSPTEGPETGGTEVTLTGTGFTDATGVTFDGADGTDFVVVSDTEITVTTPAGTPGAVEVIVEHPVEDSTPGDFTYLAVPSITSLSPTEGPETGGTAVTITGTGFTGATGVTFDGADGTDFVVVSDTEITVTTPAGTPGVAEVVIVHPIENSTPGDFTYLAVPSITGISPTEGPETGGTVVTITGTGFTGATGVTFDGADGTTFEVVSDTEITVTTPAGTPGVAEVIVEHPVEDSTPGDFTYLAVPSITSISPTEGPETGGTEVTITGTGFTDATGVTFDGADGTSFTVVSDTEITVTTPAGTPGVAEVIVVHPVENSTPGDFTYLTVPKITDITPNTGPETGGTEVTITGEGFTDCTAVTFDGVEGTNFTVVSDTEITVTTPAGTAGVAEVVIVCPIGSSEPGEFTYIEVDNAPTISDITPDSGPQTGGTEVTITGTGFTDATGVTFDGASGTEFTVVNDTTITVVTPPGAVGTADVVVQHPAGNSEPGVFTYTAVPGGPTITDITPDTGPQTGGTEVTITGTGFGECTSVTFNGVAGTGFRVVNETTIVVTTPAGSVGVAEVVVVCPNGSSAPGEFTYTAVKSGIALTGGAAMPIGIVVVLLLSGAGLLITRRVLRARA